MSQISAHGSGSIRPNGSRSALPVRLLLLTAVLVTGACDSRRVINQPEVPPPVGSTGNAPPLLELRCTAKPNETEVTCSAPEPDLADGVKGVIIGGQDLYVSLSAANVDYDAGNEEFSFDASILNLIPQPLGTEDGETAHADGVRAVFHSAPTVLTGTGVVTIENEDGTGTFTSTNQAYYEYADALLGADGILSQNETSGSRGWVFGVPTTVDEFEFLIYVAAAVPFPDGYVDVTPTADTVRLGGSASLAATVRTLVGSSMGGESVTWSSSDEDLATVDGSGNVTTLAPGSVTITAHAGARSGAATIAICPVLAVGEVYFADMPEGSSFCLGGSASAEEYTIIPVNLSSASAVDLTLTGIGIVPVSGAPTPMRAPEGAARLSRLSTSSLDRSLDARLREMEQRQLAPLMPLARQQRGTRPEGLRRTIVPGVPSVGSLMSLNVETSDPCTTNDIRTGRVMAVGDHIIILADTLNPVGFTTSDYEEIADTFDVRVYPTITDVFGEPEDVDANDRVVAFYTRAVNEMTPEGSSSFVGGFVFSRDIFPVASCATSNVGELFYMLTADPAGEVNGNARSVQFVMDKTFGTLAHEFQHLINASRRLYVNGASDFEETWLDEGLAHVAEELIFFDGAGVAPESNLGISEVIPEPVQTYFFTYIEPNLGRLRQWLLNPHTSGLFEDDDDLETRGAGWAFLRYAADRQAGTQNDFWFDLLNSQITGLDNVEAVLGEDPLPWVRDFGMAIYADDAGLGASSQFQIASWNLRELYENLDYISGEDCSCAYELDTRDPANGVEEDFTLSPGGSAGYVRVGTIADAFAGITMNAGVVEPPATVRVGVIRRK